MQKAKKLQRLLDLWAHITDTSGPDDKCQFGFHRYIEVASFSFHPRHSNRSSVHLPTCFAIMLSFFIGRLPPCLSKHLSAKLLSQELDLHLCEFPSFLKSVSCTAEIFFFFIIHNSSWKRGIFPSVKVYWHEFTFTEFLSSYEISFFHRNTLLHEESTWNTCGLYSTNKAFGMKICIKYSSCPQELPV